MGKVHYPRGMKLHERKCMRNYFFLNVCYQPCQYCGKSRIHYGELSTHLLDCSDKLTKDSFISDEILYSEFLFFVLGYKSRLIQPIVDRLVNDDKALKIAFHIYEEILRVRSGTTVCDIEYPEEFTQYFDKFAYFLSDIIEICDRKPLLVPNLAFNHRGITTSYLELFVYYFRGRESDWFRINPEYSPIMHFIPEDGEFSNYGYMVEIPDNTNQNTTLQSVIQGRQLPLAGIDTSSQQQVIDLIAHNAKYDNLASNLNILDSSSDSSEQDVNESDISDNITEESSDTGFGSNEDVGDASSSESIDSGFL